LLEAEIRGAWAAEANRRLEEIQSQKVKPIPFKQAISKVRKSLKG